MKHRAIVRFEYKGRWLMPGDPCDDMPDKDIKKYLRAGKIAKKVNPKEVVNGRTNDK